jgi:hypothetical protein
VLQWARAQAHCSTGGIRTRDHGSNNAVIPTAFATGNQNFLLFFFKSFQKRDEIGEISCACNFL